MDNNGEMIALKAGISDGWWELDHLRFGRVSQEKYSFENPLASVWTEGRGRACAFYQTESVRAAYVGGWAIGVRRFMDGLTEDGEGQ